MTKIEVGAAGRMLHLKGWGLKTYGRPSQQFAVRHA